MTSEVGEDWVLLGDIFFGGRGVPPGVGSRHSRLEQNLHVEAYSCENWQQAKHYLMVESEVVRKDRIFRGPEGHESGRNCDKLGDKNKCIQSGMLGTRLTFWVLSATRVNRDINFVAGALWE